MASIVATAAALLSSERHDGLADLSISKCTANASDVIGKVLGLGQRVPVLGADPAIVGLHVVHICRLVGVVVEQNVVDACFDCTFHVCAIRAGRREAVIYWWHAGFEIWIIW